MTSYIVDARTATPHFPGISRYAQNLVAALPGCLNEHERLFILAANAGLTHDRPRAQGPSGSEDDNSVTVIESLASPFSLSQQWRIPRQLGRLAASEPSGPQWAPYLYHSTYYLMPYQPRMCTVLTIYDLISLLYPQSVSLRARLLFRMTTRFALHASQYVIAISDATRRDLLAHYAVNPDRVVTVPLASDARFRPPSEDARRAIRSKYDLPDEFLLYFGSNKPHKNLVCLIEAYATLDPTSPPLVIAGAWDPRYPEPIQRSKNLGLEGKIRFLGRISDDDLPALYGACTLFVFPSLYEGFGLPVLEAMACGSAVACSNRSSLPEVAGDAALLFDPDDVNAIAEAMTAALQNHVLRESLRRRSLVRAACYAWSNTAQKTLNVYRDALKEALP